MFVQLNIVMVVDVNKALMTNDIENSLYMVDNSTNSTNKGTSLLSTNAKEGQVLNWIIYPMNTSAYSVSVKKISFLEEDVCLKLNSYGKKYAGLDTAPTYNYWAGMVNINLKKKKYNYKLQLELSNQYESKTFEIESPSINVE